MALSRTNKLYREDDVAFENLQMQTLTAIIESSRYKQAVAWRLDRPGHQDESLADHIAELENNLDILRNEITSTVDQFNLEEV